MEHSKDSEAIYVAQEDSHVVMSEKVQALAGSIYQEFERMINKYDEEVVKDLMPLVVNVLECLDLAYTENQEHEVELELLREDNEQLVTQYEREKHLRKNAEQKLLELEDHSEGEIKEQSGKIESLEAILRMFELKAKNAADHVSRLEEKESEMKKEYSKLHDRYTELFKTHMDYMERTKILMGTDRLENFGLSNLKKVNSMTRSAGPISFGFTSLENNSSMLKSLNSPGDIPSSNYMPDNRIGSRVNIQEEMSMEEADDQFQNGSKSLESPTSQQPQKEKEPGKSHTKKEERTANTLYQEFSFQDPELEAVEVTGNWVHPGEYASSVGDMVCVEDSENSCDSPPLHSSVNNVNDNFFGMGKEVENLILENNELLATKNALNIVKDDLIAKVDELTSEQEILREEIASLQAVKNRMKLRIQELEDDVKRIKEESEKKTKDKSDDEEDVPLAQRKRFTRVEMARVLMERNQYKERFMELQDAVRWTEMLRAAKQDPSFEKRNNSRGILNFFSNLFTTKSSPALGMTTDRLVSQGGIGPQGSPTKHPGVAVNTNVSSSDGRVGRATDMSAEKSQLEKLQLKRLGDQRRDQNNFKQIKAHVRKDDGRMQAYGWSLPAKSSNAPPVVQVNSGSKDSSKQPSSSNSGKNLPVPVPIYCRPFMEHSPGMKIFCASGVDLTGGRSKTRESSRNYTSPHVWICTATHSASRVTIIDANRPADILSSFPLCASHLLCITCVSGAKEDDIPSDEGVEYIMGEPNSQDGSESFGKVTFVKSQEESLNDSTHQIEKTEVKKTDSEIEGLKEEMEREKNQENENKDEDSTVNDENKIEIKMSSILPTMWLGAQNGYIYVHSAVTQWDKCLHKIRLPDSVLSIAHLKGRTFVSMANGTVAIFRRGNDGQWDFSGHHILDLGQLPHHSIRCLSVVNEDIWCGYRNKIHVLDVSNFSIKTTFEAHPRKESQVRSMSCCGEGVWVSIRLDSTLRLYHSVTYEHLQDVDIEPLVSKMLGTGKLGFSYARITALLIASYRLWIGTGNGVIISVPLTESTTLPVGNRGPGNIVRVSGSEETGKEIPYCSMSQAQLSFHGHRDAVKFFVAVPGTVNSLNPLETDNEEPNINVQKSNSMLVISGGEGYIDFRVGDGDESSTELKTPETTGSSRTEKAQIIIWQVNTP